MANRDTKRLDQKWNHDHARRRSVEEEEGLSVRSCGSKEEHAFNFIEREKKEDDEATTLREER